MGRFPLVVIAVGLFACKKAEPRYEGPMPVRLGDCADATVAFVSGPRPLPFTDAEARGDFSVPEAQAKTDDPPPPKEEGDAPRTEGQYRMQRPQTDPQLARQEAIDAARNAGVLGSEALSQSGAFASLTGTGDITSDFDDKNIYGGLLGNEAGEMNGGFGFGRSGFGPGGGGTGWGTIGTGRYGTIGHGSGTGHGYGVGGGRGRSAEVPAVAIGQPNAQGDLDKAIIRRYIKRNIMKIQYCYEKQLLVTPSLKGTVMAQFLISPNGTVANAAGSGMDPKVSSCVADVIKEIEFPKPKGGGSVQVNYPFTFRPVDEGASGATTPPATPEAPKPDTGPQDTARIVGPKPIDPKDAKARRLFRPTPPTSWAAYTPGQQSALAPANAAMVECLRKNPKHHGVGVLELTYDAAGAVTAAIPHGVDDELTKSCLVEAAKLAHRAPTVNAAAQRCSFAFGEQPIASLPTVELAGVSVAANGKPVADPDAKAPQIAALATVVETGAKAATAASGGIVVTEGPTVLAPTDATPMKQVARAISTIFAAGGDPILARRTAGGLALLPAIQLPVVPVPFGTGGLWLHVKGHGMSMAIDNERVVLSILVEKDKSWVGLSRVNEFEEIAKPGQLALSLKAHKASAFFADRADLEIAADDDVPYSALLAAIDEAVAAGFTEWMLTDPKSLAARPAL